MGRRTTRRIRVSVIKRAGRKNLVLKVYRPDRIEMHTSGTPRRREAERLAAELEKELNAAAGDCELSWPDFAERYKAERLRFQSSHSIESFETASAWFVELCGARHVADLTASRLSQLSAKLLDAGRSEQTARTYVARLQAAANWGHSIGLVPQPIQLRLNLTDRSQMPRPLTTEEVERVLAKTGKIVGRAAARSWRYLIRGLWLSGLRLGESMSLHWHSERHITVHNVERAEPRLRIPADQQKGRRSQLYPITPDFAKMLCETPPAERTDFVFNPLLPSGRAARSVKAVGRTIAVICRAARVVVSNDGDVHYATAKHFRHSFGARWAPHVSEVLLMTLMRHQSIETTRKYYVGIAANETSEKIRTVWQQHFVAPSGDIFGDT